MSRVDIDRIRQVHGEANNTPADAAYFKSHAYGFVDSLLRMVSDLEFDLRKLRESKTVYAYTPEPEDEECRCAVMAMPPCSRCTDGPAYDDEEPAAEPGPRTLARRARKERVVIEVGRVASVEEFARATERGRAIERGEVELLPAQISGSCPDCGAVLPPAPSPEHLAALLAVHRPVCPRRPEEKP